MTGIGWYRWLVLPTLTVMQAVMALMSAKVRTRIKELGSKVNIPDSAGRLRLWVHAASMGEFEQIVTVIEELSPEWSIVVSFTSPSGLAHARRRTDIIDAVFILPIDWPWSMRALTKQIKPTVVLFSRYDVWPGLAHELKLQGVPTMLVNATTPSAANGWLRIFYRSLYKTLTVIHAVSHESAQNVGELVEREIQYVPDTRYDRVLRVAELSNTSGTNERELILVVGSSWDADEDLLSDACKLDPKMNIRRIIVPHEPTEKRVASLIEKFNASRFSESGLEGNRDVVVDSVGHLLQIYSRASAAFVGGGFGAGVHAVAEPAAFGIPISCGPNISRSYDAQQLVQFGGVECVKTPTEMLTWLSDIVLNEQQRKHFGDKNKLWIRERSGASAATAAVIRQLAASTRDN